MKTILGNLKKTSIARILSMNLKRSEKRRKKNQKTRPPTNASLALAIRKNPTTRNLLIEDLVAVWIPRESLEPQIRLAN